MKKTLITLMAFFLFQSPLSASDELDVDPLSNINVSKEDIIKSLESLQKLGKISQADLDKAKKELSALNDSQIKSITDTAVDVIRKDPDKALGLVNAVKVDTNEVKKQIESAPPKP
jgi:PAB1-binding protein PBP1